MPFFSLEFSEDAKEEIRGVTDNPEELQDIFSSLGVFVRKVHSSSSYSKSKVPMVECLQHLLICGNGLLFEDPTGAGLSFIPLTHYVVARDCTGLVIELCTLTVTSIIGLPSGVRDLVVNERRRKGLKHTLDERVELFTYAIRTEKGFKVIQTVEDVIVKAAEEIAETKFPWIPLRWSSTYGEAYGRGLVENYILDFKTISDLSEAVVRGAVLSCDVKFLVNPSSDLDIQEVADSESGACIAGREGDIVPLQLARYVDLTPIAELVKEYERKVGHAFLLQAGNRREGERVTAYELRLDAQELNESLGGVYSLLAETLQRPYAYLSLEREGFKLPSGTVSPSILTGIDALGRASDLDKLRVFTETIGMTNNWTQDLQARTDAYKLAARVANTLGLDIDFIRNDAEQAKIQQQQQAAQQEDMLAAEASKAAPNMIQSAFGG